MIAEIIPKAYDIHGRPISMMTRKNIRALHPSYPLGRFLSQPLAVHCSDLEDIRKFIVGCRYVSDQEQFGKKDYWMPPEQFEVTKKGDCEDFALWVWRQLMTMGYQARIVFGRSGRYGEGHSWVMFQANGKHYLLEPIACWFGKKLARLSTVRYRPEFSIEFDGDKIRYFAHEEMPFNPSLKLAIFLVCEWVYYNMRFWFLVLRGLFVLPIRRIQKSVVNRMI
jgi:Bacterial transglutaminase-like cysteine proteinase BTLCP